MDGDYARHVYIISLFEKLLDQLRTAFAHGHRSQSSVSGMGVRSENHRSAFRQHLTSVLVDDRLMRRNVYAAVLLGTAKSKHVVIFIYGTAYSAKAVMAVGQHIWNRELLESGRSGSLDDSDKSDVV